VASGHWELTMIDRQVTFLLNISLFHSVKALVRNYFNGLALYFQSVPCCSLTDSPLVT
jgi:hypothetical protein